MRYIKVRDCGSCDNCFEGFTDHYFCKDIGAEVTDCMTSIHKDCPLPKLNKTLVIGFEEMYFVRPPTHIALKRGYNLISVIQFVGFAHVPDAVAVTRENDTLIIEV